MPKTQGFKTSHLILFIEFIKLCFYSPESCPDQRNSWDLQVNACFHGFVDLCAYMDMMSELFSITLPYWEWYPRTLLGHGTVVADDDWLKIIDTIDGV